MDPAILDCDALTLARALFIIIARSGARASSTEHAADIEALDLAFSGEPSASAALAHRLADVERPFYALPACTPPHVVLFPIAARLALALQAGTADEETTARGRREAFGALVRSYESRGSTPELAQIEAVAVLEHAAATARRNDAEFNRLEPPAGYRRELTAFGARFVFDATTAFGARFVASVDATTEPADAGDAPQGAA